MKILKVSGSTAVEVDLTPAEEAQFIADQIGTVAQARERKLAQLDAARKAAETASVTVQGKPFPATEEFQAKISRALNYIGRGKPLNLDGAWRDSNASPVAMTTILLGQLEDAITSQGVAAWAKYWTKFDAVMAAATVDAVNAVEW
jgi:hypothetical protein